MPPNDHPHVLGRDLPRPREDGAEPAPLIGWGAELAAPQFADRRRRAVPGRRPPPLGQTIEPGERFRYDVFFSGNPTGLAEAKIVAEEPGPRGSPPILRLQGYARTSGVVALLTTISYSLENIVDAKTAAPVSTTVEINREGLSSKYKHRVTETTYFGRGHAEIVDSKDGKETTSTRKTPVDTYDALSVMAWVRALKLADGETAKAYALDGRTLLRVDITSHGASRLEQMPTIGTALGIANDQVYELEGTITRVDRHGAAIPGRRTYALRVWISDDGRRIPLVLESDMWLGVIRLVLTQYDPPLSKRGRDQRSRAGQEQARGGGGSPPSLVLGPAAAASISDRPR